MFKPPVLCVTRAALTAQKIPDNNAYGIFPFNLSTIPDKNFHFIHRDIVDNDRPEYVEIGQALPQILGYCVIQCEDKILTYSRKKGAEAKLKDKRSIGFGGHVDIDDYNKNENRPFIAALLNSIERELREELNHVEAIGTKQLDKIIVDQTNLVGSVHVGLPLMLQLRSPDLISVDPNEINDPQWLSIEELKKDIEIYENWSKLIIENI